MTKQPRKPPASTKRDDAIAEPLAPVEHVPVIAGDDMAMSDHLRAALDRALAEGTRVDTGDHCWATIVAAPTEAAVVTLSKASQFLYVSFGDVRPSMRWLPVAHLRPATLNGWRYDLAGRLYVEPSIAIFVELERLFGRGEAAATAASQSGGTDANAGRLSSVEAVKIDAMAQVDNQGIASASVSEIIRYRGTWLPFRRRSKLEMRRAAEMPWAGLSYNPLITPP
jgi:hypothetical protein